MLLTFQWLHVHLEVSKDVDVLLKHLVVQVYCTCCPPCLLTKANSGRREGGSRRREKGGRGRKVTRARMYILTHTVQVHWLCVHVLFLAVLFLV